MPRKNTNEEVYKQIDEGGLILDQAAGVNTTLSAAAAAGASTVTLTSATGGVAGDLIRVGAGNTLEECIIASLATNVATLRSPLAYAHAIGEVVVERQKVKHGEVTDQGVRVNSTINETAIKTASTRSVYIKIITDTDHMVTWSTINHNLENIASSYGIASTAITGTGTVASPERLVITPFNVRSLLNVSVYFVGLLADGRTQEIQGWSVDLGQSGDRTYNSGPGTPVALGGSCRTLAHYIYQ